jgi:hypothetical protein
MGDRERYGAGSRDAADRASGWGCRSSSFCSIGVFVVARGKKIPRGLPFGL